MPGRIRCGTLPKMYRVGKGTSALPNPVMTSAKNECAIINSACHGNRLNGKIQHSEARFSSSVEAT
jgi:hypothetical protein